MEGKEVEPSSTEIFKRAVDAGIKRLQRKSLEIGISGLIAGMNVTFGAIAAGAVAGSIISSFGHDTELFAEVLGAAVFPIGFIFLVFGKSDLFTENFLVPTSAVIARKAKIRSLLRLWTVTLLGNLIGAVIVAKLMSLEHYHGVPAVHTIQHIHDIAEFQALERDWDAAFYAGVFAGWLITLMTWILLASQDAMVRLAIVWCVGFLIMLNKFNHVVINTSEILMAIFTGNELITYSAWIENNFLPTLLGNIVGGLVFVTLLEYLRVRNAIGKWH